MIPAGSSFQNQTSSTAEGRLDANRGGFGAININQGIPTEKLAIGLGIAALVGLGAVAVMRSKKGK